VDRPVAFTPSQVTTVGGVLSASSCVIVAEEVDCIDRCEFVELPVVLPLISVLGSEAVSEVAVGLLDEVGGVDVTLGGFSRLLLILGALDFELEEANTDVVDA
jgi:hypothetical protein